MIFLYLLYKKLVRKYIGKTSLFNFYLGYYAIFFGATVLTLLRGMKYDIVVTSGLMFLLISLIPQYITSSTNNKKKHHKKMYEKDNSVIIVKDSNFDKIISSIDILILFYKNDDANCNQFLPTYTQASLTLRNHKPHLYFGKIECNTNPKSCEKDRKSVV